MRTLPQQDWDATCRTTGSGFSAPLLTLAPSSLEEGCLACILQGSKDERKQCSSCQFRELQGEETENSNISKNIKTGLRAGLGARSLRGGLQEEAVPRLLLGVLCCASVFCELKEGELCPWKGGDKVSKRVEIRQEEPRAEWVIITRLERKNSDVTKTGGTSLEFQKLRQEDCRLKVELQSEFIQGQLGQLIKALAKNEKKKSMRGGRSWMMDEYYLDTVVHANNPAVGRWRQEDLEFKGSLGCRRSSFKTFKGKQQKERYWAGEMTQRVNSLLS